MMKKILVLFLLFAISSCEKDFVVKEQQEAKRMTVNCLLDNLNVVKVFVTESTTLSGSTGITSIPNAHVELYENDSLLLVLPYVSSDSANTFGSYQTSLVPISGKKYSVKVIHPVYGTATAEDFFPSPPQVNLYQLEHYGNRAEHHNKVDFKLQFQDDGATTDYYKLNVWLYGQEWNWQYVNGGAHTDSTLDYYTWNAMPEINSSLTDTVRVNGYSLLFSDKNFNGNGKELNFWFQGRDTSDVVSTFVIVDLQHISHAQYEYYRTLELYHKSSQGSEPVNVYDNIENGYGIFMCSNIYSDYVRVK